MCAIVSSTTFVQAWSYRPLTIRGGWSLRKRADKARKVAAVPLMRCPHCGAKNFTMEGWEDLDHCSSCGKPLGELERNAVDAADYAARGRKAGRRQSLGGDGQNA